MIEIKVVNDSVIVSRQAIVKHTQGTPEVRVQFQFDASWDGLHKTAFFKNKNSDIEYTYIIGEEPIWIPHEVLEVTGDIMVGVLGSNEKGVVKPTLYYKMGFVFGGGVEPDNAVNGTPQSKTLLEQIYEDVNETKKIAQSVRQDADVGKFDGFSPIVTTEQTLNGILIKVTDKNGTTTSELKGGGSGGIVGFGENMNFIDGVLSVKTTNDLSESELPITSYGVQKTVGNIEVLLKGI